MATDPLHYFRIESKELHEGMLRAVLDLERGQGQEAVKRLLRLAHTFKGAARVVGQGLIADQAHALEDLLAPFRAGEAMSVAIQHQVVACIATIAVAITALDQPMPVPAVTARIASAVASPVVSAPPQVQAAVSVTNAVPVIAGGVDETFSHIRADVAEVDSLVESIAELGTRVAGMRLRMEAHLAALNSGTSTSTGASEQSAHIRGDWRTLDADFDRVQSQLVMTLEQGNHLRLVAVEPVLLALERAVRDAVHQLGHDVRFTAVGGDVRLDGHILAIMKGALTHLVRNAVAHGSEPLVARREAGKPDQGLVEIRVERRGHRIHFHCRDDGRGIDVAAIALIAQQRGLLTPAAAAHLDLASAVQLLFRGGVSTTGRADAVSGRGVGLDAVAEAVRRCTGEIRVDSTPGRGTTIEVAVPVSLSAIPVLTVVVKGCTVCLPLDTVRRSLRVRAEDLVRTPEGISLVVDGGALPVLDLARILPVMVEPPPRPPAAAMTAVIVRTSAGAMVVVVDQLTGTQDVIVRPLPAHLRSIELVAGAAFGTDGSPILILDPTQLGQAKTLPGVALSKFARRAQTLPILVIDDSLTTRMLEKGILEAAGYTVALATSAEEGLAKARSGRYGLFLVDVEMPGMDGFGFLAAARQDAALAMVPGILMTSRGSADDRRRGLAAGARAHFIKSEFDEHLLLTTICSLVLEG